MILSNMPYRAKPVLALSNRTVGFWSDGSSFWGGISIYSNGSMTFTSSLDQFNTLFEPVANAGDRVGVATSFFNDYEVRCTIISGTRHAPSSTIANNTWGVGGAFNLDIAGGSFTLEIRAMGGDQILATCTITVS